MHSYSSQSPLRRMSHHPRQLRHGWVDSQSCCLLSNRRLQMFGKRSRMTGCNKGNSSLKSSCRNRHRRLITMQIPAKGLNLLHWLCPALFLSIPPSIPLIILGCVASCCVCSIVPSVRSFNACLHSAHHSRKLDGSQY